MKKYRKRLSTEISSLEEIKAKLEGIRDEAQEYYDGRSDSWSNSERGEKFSSKLSDLELSITGIEAAIEDLGNAAAEDDED